jgi:hypothetical protein
MAQSRMGIWLRNLISSHVHSQGKKKNIENFLHGIVIDPRGGSIIPIKPSTCYIEVYMKGCVQENQRESEICISSSDLSSSTSSSPLIRSCNVRMNNDNCDLSNVKGSFRNVSAFMNSGDSLSRFCGR